MPVLSTLKSDIAAIPGLAADQPVILDKVVKVITSTLEAAICYRVFAEAGIVIAEKVVHEFRPFNDLMHILSSVSDLIKKGQDPKAFFKAELQVIHNIATAASSVLTLVKASQTYGFVSRIPAISPAKEICGLTSTLIDLRNSVVAYVEASPKAIESPDQYHVRIVNQRLTIIAQVARGAFFVMTLAFKNTAGTGVILRIVGWVAEDADRILKPLAIIMNVTGLYKDAHAGREENERKKKAHSS